MKALRTLERQYTSTELQGVNKSQNDIPTVTAMTEQN
jgi:hypothetical protein